ncbi:hypothetical protein DFH07DRAFT_942882 [Mycena maculata]|uniref:BTB domain-containing protein n=1 Tax=Mycena maculata TaxID=230809 RepID=A0AAD7N4G9_9AGAR|nr:hypothetical protein DFH07DRAFT_942882 [Mycena maculata]
MSIAQLPRTYSEEAVTTNISWRRIDGLWFKDGTLILVAGTSLFRVYGGLLAEQSPVFHDMLDFPQPADGEVIDGCPVVHLADDEDDLRCFLKALFDIEFFEPAPAKTTFEILAGIIRLSTKYQVDVLRRRALSHFASIVSFTAAEYRSNSSESWDIPKQEWIRVVVLAREMSIDWILPIALYRVAGNCTPTELLDGIDVNGGVHAELAHQDKIACLEQSLVIRTTASAEILDFLWNPLSIPGCSDKAECTRRRIQARKLVEDARKNRIFPVKIWPTSNWAVFSVCKSCMGVMKADHQQALETFWDGLPQRFGLPDWDALKQMKESDLA